LAPRDGGRKSQRNTDVVRRRRITRARLLVATGAGSTPADTATRLGGGETASLLGALSDLEVLRGQEITLKKEHTAAVMGVVKTLTRTHVLSRSLSQQPMDPTAWYRLSNTHRDEMAAQFGARPPVTDEDAPILADLVRAMRFANGAYGTVGGRAFPVYTSLTPSIAAVHP
jgi:hypothetical protein